MKTYRVSIKTTGVGEVLIEAENEEKAKELAENVDRGDVEYTDFLIEDEVVSIEEVE